MLPKVRWPLCRLVFSGLAPWLGEDTVASDTLFGDELGPKINLPSGELETYQVVVDVSVDAALRAVAAEMSTNPSSAPVTFMLQIERGASRESVLRLLSDVSISLRAKVPSESAPKLQSQISGRLYRLVNDTYFQLIETFYS